MIEPRQIKLDDISRHSQIEQSGPLRIEGKLLAPPLKIAEILARICKIDARRIPPPIPPSLIRLMGQDIRLDPRRAESELGIRFRDTQAALEQTARWFTETSIAP